MPKLTRHAAPRSTAITASMFKELEQENNELADELTAYVYQLAETTIKLDKLSQLTGVPHESISVDEVEIALMLDGAL